MHGTGDPAGNVVHETHRFLEASLIARFVVLALAQPKRALLCACSRTASTNSDYEISGIMELGGGPQRVTPTSRTMYQS